MNIAELLQQPNLNRVHLGQELYSLCEERGPQYLLEELTDFPGKLILKGEEQLPFLLRIDLQPYLPPKATGKMLLHVFYQGDGDGLHSHPVEWAWAKILAGDGYVEQRQREDLYLKGIEPESFERLPGNEVAFNFLQSDYEILHRVERLKGPFSMSLFQNGPRKDPEEWKIVLSDRSIWDMSQDQSYDKPFRSWKEVEHLLPDVF